MLLSRHKNSLLLRTIIHIKDKPRFYMEQHIAALQHLNENDPWIKAQLEQIKQLRIVKTLEDIKP